MREILPYEDIHQSRAAGCYVVGGSSGQQCADTGFRWNRYWSATAAASGGRSRNTGTRIRVGRGLLVSGRTAL